MPPLPPRLLQLKTLLLERGRQGYARIRGYFRGAADPALPPLERAASGARGIGALLAIALALLLAYTVILIPFTPRIADIRKAKLDQPALVLSADGKQLAEFRRLNREWVELDEVSPHVIKALIATEDHRFYQHHGVDLVRIAGGLLRTVQGDVEGGSTLTQQLARNLYPEQIGRKRSITRKLKELITALKIEYAYSKQEILVTYLNTMPFLYNAFGIEMAANTYFDKPARRLNVAESATLIGMLKGTSYYNPVRNPERALKRRNVVLAQMVKRGVLTQSEFERLKKRPLRLDFNRPDEQFGPAPHFAEHVRKWLIDWADRNDYDIHADGLRVHTTLDSRLQAMAEQTVKRQLERLQAVADVEWGVRSGRLISTSTATYVNMRRRVPPFDYYWKSRPRQVDAFVRESAEYAEAVANGSAPEAALVRLRNDAAFMARLRADKTRLQAGFVALDPASGQIKAWVGSRDFLHDRFDHVARARRQPGSTFKPFVYGAALEQGMSPRKLFTDHAVEIPLANGEVWRPNDVSAPSERQISARDGLVYSRNRITAQVMQEAGPRQVMAFARKAGVNQSELEPVPALALGVSPVSLLEMVSAYGTIAALGEYRPPQFVTRITDKHGNVLASFPAEGKRVMQETTAVNLIDMMRGVVNRGTGRAIRTTYGIRADVAGKTGTTQYNADGWFILMHPQLVAGAWVGFNDPRVTMRSDYWGQGARNALPVVGDFFRKTLNARLVDRRVEFPAPDRSLMGRIIDQIDAWFGWQEPAPVPVPPPEPQYQTPIDEVERIINEAWQREQAGEAGASLQRSLDEQLQAVEDARRQLERLGGVLGAPAASDAESQAASERELQQLEQERLRQQQQREAEQYQSEQQKLPGWN